MIASVAGMVPMPYTGAYGASKAALISMGRTLSVELHGTGMSCTTICPGFVESEITGVNNEGVFTPEKVRRNPLEWTTVRAVRVMLKAIERRRRFFVFTGHGRVTAFVGRHFPALIHFVMTRPSAMRATRKRDRSPRHS